MQFFHASTLNFTGGRVVTASMPTPLYSATVNAIELQKPAHAPSRSICLFASESKEFSTQFLIGEGVPIAEIKLYEVKFNHYWRSPFSLVNAISKRIISGGDISSQISEYWNPTLPWNYYEIFGPTMEIISKVEVSDIPFMSHVNFKSKYFADFDRANKM